MERRILALSQFSTTKKELRVLQMQQLNATFRQKKGHFVASRSRVPELVYLYEIIFTVRYFSVVIPNALVTRRYALNKRVLDCTRHLKSSFSAYKVSISDH